MHPLPDLASWRQNTDPVQAERRVAWLQSRIADADEAIAAQQKLISMDGPLDAYTLSLESLKAAQVADESALASIMELREREVLNFALDGARYSNHRAPAKALSEFLLAMQKLYLRVGQAITTPRPGRNLSAEIANLCQLEVAGFYPSSFGIRFVAPTRSDYTGYSVTTTALETTFDLLNADNPVDEAAKVGKWALSKYRSLVHTMVLAEATPKVSWTSPAGEERSWVVDDNHLLVLANRLAHIRDTDPRTREAVGTLTGASLRRKRFEFSTGGEVITGSAPKELSEKITSHFGRVCAITFIETSFIDETTDQEKKTRTLIDVRGV